MGTAISLESGRGISGGDSVATATFDEASPSSNFGFSSQEAQHLSSLRRLATIDETKRSGSTFIEVLWILSRRHLAPPSDQSRCQQVSALFSTFPSLSKLHPLEDIFVNHDQFLETLSYLIGDNEYRRNDVSMEFLSSVCICDDESIPAYDVVELCFEMASISHYLLQENAFDDADGVIELMGMRNFSSENSIVQSMTNSLLEYAKKCREDDRHFGKYVGNGAFANSTSPMIADGNVTRAELSDWQRKVVPDLILCSLARFLRVVLFPPEYATFRQNGTKPFPTVRTSKEITSQITTRVKEGEIVPISSQIFGLITNGQTAGTILSAPVFAFASISVPKLGEKWYQIYAGETDGWTFQALENSILGYEGPTILVIQANSDHDRNATVTLGAYTASKWEKNKRDFFGTPDCFLFQLQPTLRVLNSLPKSGTRGGHYMYFHSNTNVQTNNPLRKDDLTEGLGFGGTVRKPRLFIDGNLEYCSVSDQDTSFEEGCLGLPPSNDPFSSMLSTSTYNIYSLEVYAVGDETSIHGGFRAQRQHRDIADATLRNARTVDKAAFLGDMRNGFIETKAFAHRGQVDGRANGYLKGPEGKANGL
ncbi:hypothetical protein ACHAXA_004811 [Cyclostephanos tholiformis]|uniref:Oxidation resistance protein 1 n=1 Tax=Cyclostephanos tholiformis TaxID=382380 RepID=A0ABD3RWM0_9STRA